MPHHARTDPTARSLRPAPGGAWVEVAIGPDHLRGALAALSAVLLVLMIPRGGLGEREVHVAFLGDEGTGGRRQKAVRDQLQRRGPRLVFLLGDNVYDEGQAERIRERYDDVYQPVMMRGATFHAALGNHDVKRCSVAPLDPLGAGASAYRWQTPGCDVEDHLNHAAFGYRDQRRYYSVGSSDGSSPLMEVFVLDSNTLGDAKLDPPREDGAQLEWLDTALTRSRAVWKVVAMHHPLHSGYSKESREEMRMGLRAQLKPIFESHEVDAVFSGHDHIYSRGTPSGGVRYFVSGGGGGGLYHVEDLPDDIAVAGSFHHFVYVRATESVFEYYAIDSEGRSRDAGSFVKGASVDVPFPEGTLPPR